jgi:hypothetical protein
LSHLDKHGPVIDVDHLFRMHLRKIQSNPVKVRIRFAVMDKARRDKEVDECAQLELLDAIDRQLAALIADSCDLKAVLGLNLSLGSIISGKGWD